MLSLLIAVVNIQGTPLVDQFSKNFVDTKDNPRLQQITIIPQNYDIGLLYSNEDFRRWVNVVHNIEIEKRLVI